ncbi:GntR family transcriptional regulator [Agrilactobacillus composti DSM 18527 = JCM 14202]|uniref:GntR family transcriptional regulator n=1 Tax=Agrilactobacillus composti DSM 18527 = JCM 14202 TaxID=1423734 RepID=X0PUT1_9LACO|nr:PLP-dependent aminotransferase family protein [Agrilactobacillus composti]KRM34646.1 GntR family transcriptional regulator [Agrilactobacillus composti DSM 18527 = JCM 14202]GAF41186.1 transcriptional regulator, GntR family domain [Agrilactobacillus composti DSM 18527 = JCM 14202]
MNYHFSSRVPKSDVDPVGDILKIAGKPGIISFAGGLPAPELFPVTQIAQATAQVLQEKGRDALQYGSSQGIQELRNVIVDRVKLAGIHTDANHIMVATGSQQTLDLTGKNFLDKGDTVIVERPTYLCAVDVFKSYGAHFAGVNMDDAGMKMAELEQALIDNPSAKLIYTIPNFQNPTGRTMSLARRQKVAELAEKYDVMVLEDNPYGAVRFAGNSLPSIKSFDKSGHVIYMGTFSKILAPGMRLGWIVTETKLLSKYTMMKQSADLHTDNLSQYIVAKYVAMFDINRHIQSICKLYQKRERLMMNAIHKYFPSHVKCSQPEGGMFIWVEIPAIKDTQALFAECIKNNVAFVPGEPFYEDQGDPGNFRLNYSNMCDDQIETGIKRLGAVIKQMINC